MKKLKKYKRILKQKDQEINSLSQYNAAESVANDGNLLYPINESGRPMSCSVNQFGR